MVMKHDFKFNSPWRGQLGSKFLEILHFTTTHIYNCDQRKCSELIPDCIEAACIKVTIVTITDFAW